MTTRITRTLALFAAVAMAGGQARAQLAVTPRALGMGGAYAAMARGQEALFQNPANLGLSGTPRWSAAVAQVAAGAGARGTALGDLLDLGDAGALAQPRRDQILAGVPASGVDAQVDVRVPLAAVQVDRFAVGAAWAGSLRQNVGRDLVDLVLNGYQSGRTDYSVGGTGGTRFSFFDLSAAYARRAGPVSVGVAAHLLVGGTLARSRLFEPEFDLEAEDLSAEYREVHARGGRGWAVDVGVAAEPVPGLTVSAAVTSLAAGMKWPDELRTRHVVLRRATFQGDGVSSQSAGRDQDFTTSRFPAIQAAFRAVNGTPASVVIEGLAGARTVAHRVALSPTPLRGAGRTLCGASDVRRDVAGGVDDLDVQARRPSSAAVRGLGGTEFPRGGNGRG